MQRYPDGVTSLSQPEANESRRGRPPAVRVEGVVKRFGSTTALAGVDLEVPEGMVFGLLGPNGAGKTTLIRILATLLVPDAGRAELLGHDVVAESSSVRRSWKVSSFGGLAGSSSRSSSRRVSSCPMRATFLSNSDDAPAWSAWWWE